MRLATVPRVLFANLDFAGEAQQWNLRRVLNEDAMKPACRRVSTAVTASSELRDVPLKGSLRSRCSAEAYMPLALDYERQVKIHGGVDSSRIASIINRLSAVPACRFDPERSGERNPEDRTIHAVSDAF